MKLAAYFRSLAARFFRPSQTDNDMEEELCSHIQHRVSDLERSGFLRVSLFFSSASLCLPVISRRGEHG
jgi:hypothetical protein